MAKCSEETCYWSDDVPCSLGHLDPPSDCPALKAAPAPKQDDQPSPETVAMPWSGRVLGLTDLGFVAGRSKPIVLAVLGPHKAGKTTLLGACYLLLGRGLRPNEDLRFSGSNSLAGWENVASPLRWKPGPRSPAFPPHTTTTTARSPGLLHLAFKQDHDYRTDYVITDAPGEWFSKWAIERDAPDAEGARWVAEHADAFMLVADCEALAESSNMGAARSGIRLLARRLADELQGRPVALVWTKSDVPISDEMKKTVRSAVLNLMPDTPEFAVTVMHNSDEQENVQGFLDLLRWVLNIRRLTVRLPEPSAANIDPLFRFSAR